MAVMEGSQCRPSTVAVATLTQRVHLASPAFADQRPRTYGQHFEPRRCGRSILLPVTQEPAPKYWNVIVSPKRQGKGRARDDAVAVDKDRDWIERRILQPRREGRAIAVGGHTLAWDEIERIRITVADAPSAVRIEQIRASDRASSVAMIGGPSFKWRAAAYAEDVTDDLIEGPPGTSSEAGAAPGRVDPRRVMVVYGRDGEARRAMFDYLRAPVLEPGEWRKLVAETEKGAPYIGEILERAFESAAAVVVLLTPDDEARLREEFVTERDPEHERQLTPQARPNVLFEAGMAFGVHPDRTVLVELGVMRPFSDVFGRHVVRLDGTAGPVRDIASRLKSRGVRCRRGRRRLGGPGPLPQPLIRGASQSDDRPTLVAANAARSRTAASLTRHDRERGGLGRAGRRRRSSAHERVHPAPQHVRELVAESSATLEEFDTAFPEIEPAEIDSHEHPRLMAQRGIRYAPHARQARALLGQLAGWVSGLIAELEYEQRSGHSE
jgi:predicted nucleotide-binding protein